MPFNFISIGTTLSGILSGMTDAAITGREDVDGTAAIVVRGGVTSDAMAVLITGADPGNAITLTLWIDEAEQELLRMRFAGQLYNDDAPETTRLLIISGIDVPVDIQLPDIASGS